jgi:hypothetical protein
VSGAPDHASRVTDDEPPPILGSWKRIYIVVLCYLAVLILAMYIFGRAVRP